jgi:GT2 family glycosyltransferase
MTAPGVSVVVPLHGACELLPETFGALREHTPEAHEIVVVDNASPDDGAGWVERNVEGARIVRNERNLGFGIACNQGALASGAPLICFLNSDARVQPGWLAALRRALDRNPRAAAAVPRFLEPDGALQEAGAVVDGAGEGVLLGYRHAADDPRYLFPRVVEYGSAACLLVRRTCFEAVGGFDPAYGLAYFEDADLAYRLSALGHRVVYTPDASVVHLRNASPRPPGLEALRDRNRTLFATRWRARFEGRPVYDEHRPDRILALRDAGCARRLVVVVAELPEPAAREAAATILGAAEIAGPDTRVTALAGTAAADRARVWRDRGVEVIDADDPRAFWQERTGQVTAVWSVDADVPAVDALAAAQPQAVWVRTSSAGPGRPGTVAPPASPEAALRALGWPAGRETAG